MPYDNGILFIVESNRDIIMQTPKKTLRPLMKPIRKTPEQLRGGISTTAEQEAVDNIISNVLGQLETKSQIIGY